MNLPNKLTILRIILVPFFVLFMLLSGDIFPHHNLVALAIFGIASYTDHLDGKIVSGIIYAKDAKDLFTEL